MAVAVLTACGPSDRDNQPAIDAASQADAADAPPQVDTSKVYAHSGTVLYRLNNLTLAATPIGTMTGLDAGLLDLAVNKDDELFGVTREKLYRLSATTGAATLVKDLSADSRGFTSLSFAPKTFSDPNSADVLVTANDQGDVFQIDLSGSQAVATPLGSYGTDSVKGKIVSSGDLIAVRGFGIYATVDVGSETMDYLAQIDPMTWKATLIGPIGFDKIFGLGFWGGKIYGFVDDGFEAGTGDVIEINKTTGAGISLGSADIRWFGAGVATDAPIFE